MKLLTSAILKALPALNSNDPCKNCKHGVDESASIAGCAVCKCADHSYDPRGPKLIVKFFGGGSASWYGAKYDPASETFFGYVTGLGDDEWGYFSFEELKAIKFPPFGLPLERDKFFTPCYQDELKG